MAFFELKDSFSLKSQQYGLTTTVEIEKKAIKFVYYRQGNAIFSTARSYRPSLRDEQIKKLASKVHEFYKREIAKLFQLASKLRQNSIHDTSMDLLARGFLKYGMDLEAITLLEPLVYRSSDFPRSQFTLGKALIAVKKFKAARRQYLNLLAGQRKYADSHFYLGLCEYNLRDCAAAFHAFAKAVEINPHYGEAFFYLGLTLLLNAILNQQQDLTRNLTERAKKVFLNALKNLPELKVRQAQQGLILIEKEDYHKAYDFLAPLSKIVEKRIKPDILNYEFHLHVLFEPHEVRPEKVWQEIQRLQRLIPQYPQYPDLQYELGFTFAVLGASVSATSLNHFEKAVGLNPDYKNALKGLKLIQNDQRGYATMLRALMKAY